LIDSWDDPEQNRLKQQLLDRWCSWCFEKGDHTAFEKTTSDSPTYTCEVCFKCTTKCNECSEGMAKKGTLKSSARCAQCQAKKKHIRVEADTDDGV
jgi:hypothetical protein